MLDMCKRKKSAKMRQLIRSLRFGALFTTFLLILTACGPTEVIRVVVTPTPDPDAIIMSEPTTTDTATDTPTQSPTATLTSEPTATIAPPLSATPEEATSAVTMVIGPIIGADYVRPTLPPQPTPTGQPTEEILESPTAGPPPTEGPSPTPVPGLNPNDMGLQLDVNLSYEDFQTAVGLAEGTGVKWIKLQVNWDFLQPDGPNQMDRLQLFERQVELASRPEGMRVLLSVAKAPRWARSNLSESGPPDNPQQLADFLILILRDTKIGQSIDAIEIWNEPNLQREWQGAFPLSGAGYMQIFRPAYQAVRAYSSSMTVVTAGLAPTSNLPGAVDDRDYLQQMYDAGLRDFISDPNLVIGIHPYGWANDPAARCCGDPNSEPGWDDNPHFFFLENIESTRRIMERNGHSAGKMWPTEFGWSTWEGIPTTPPEAWHTYLNSVQQADYIMRAFQFGQRTDYIGPMFLWNLNFSNATTVRDGNEIVGFSLIHPTFPVQERPAYWAIARSTGKVPN
jgi:polysaccharide biosynthesis protein PslG